MVVNGENMAQASAMLKGDDTYKEDLVSVNDLYGSPYDDTDSSGDSEEEIENCRTPSPKRKREEDECPPAPKKHRCQSPMQAFLEEQNESDLFTKENDMQKGDEIVTEVVSGEHVIQLVKLAYPRVIATTAEGNIMENEDGSIIFPNGVTYQSEVTSVYSDSTMPGGVIDDDGCIKKDAPNLVLDHTGYESESDPDAVAEELALENCQENHSVGCTKCWMHRTWYWM